MNKLSVIVPFYNEERYLKKSIQRLLTENIFEKIILVDDCSSDNSFNIAKSISQSYEHIVLISTSKNTGKGHAIKIALKEVETSHVIVHDADLEYFPNDIPEMFHEASKNINTLVLGSRVIGKKERTTLYKSTFYGQKIFSIIFSFLHKKKISDIATCYWLIETENLRKMNICENGFAIEIEVLSKAIKSGFKIIEIPIKYEARSYEEGKKIRSKDAIKIFLKIFKYFILN